MKTKNLNIKADMPEERPKIQLTPELKKEIEKMIEQKLRESYVTRKEEIKSS
jgi:hypothetical protein